MLLTGSQAINFHKNKPYSDKSDYDIIAYEDEIKYLGLSFNGKYSIKYGNIEFINMSVLDNFYIGFNSNKISITIDGKIYCIHICSITDLYIQKRSHAHRPLKFEKTIHDLKYLKNHKDFDSLYSATDKIILEKRTKLTKKLFKDRVPLLNQKNEDFFNDAVSKYYIHDDIHKVMAHYDKPLYTKMKHDSSLAKCEYELWKNFSYKEKIECVREECYVIAIERFVVPKLETSKPFMSANFSFNAALNKVCTTLCSGWFRDFAIDNYFEIMKFDVDFYKKFFDAVQNNKLKKVNKE